MKTSSVITPVILFPRAAGQPLYDWLYLNLRQALTLALYPQGAKLPSTRALSQVFGVSRGVVVRVFEQLAAEGYVSARTGSGTRVLAVPDRHFEGARLGDIHPEAPSGRRFSSLGAIVLRPDAYEPGAVRAFRANRPALDLFPTTLWARLVSRRLRWAPSSLLAGGDPLGYLPLRQAVARYLGASRGVRCDAGQVIVVSGVQAALDLTARLFVDPGDRVGVEQPGYPGATDVFRSWGAVVQGLPVDKDGLVVDLPRDLKVVYTTPAHQFPTSVTLSLTRRWALVEWARTTGNLVFEDDYDGEFRYSGRSIPAVQGLDPHGHVVFAGSFSKLLFPGLRLGYLVVPPDLVDRYAAVHAVTQRHAPLVDQAALVDFFDDGHFGRHLRAMRQVYAGRLGTLTEAVAAQLSGRLTLSSVEAGLQTVAWLTQGDAEAVASAVRHRRVEVTPVSRFGPGAPEGLLLGFAAVDDAEIVRGVRELASVLDPAVPSPGQKKSGPQGPL